MEIVDFKEKTENKGNTELSYNTFPESENRLTKTNTFSKSNSLFFLILINSFQKRNP